jgi:cell division septation protein DedD
MSRLFLFLGLVLLNLLLFAGLRGMFGTSGSGREPARLEQQVAQDRIRVLTEQEVDQLDRRTREAKPVPAPVVAPIASDATVSCLELGEFTNDAQLTRLRDKLAALKLMDRASEQTRDRPGWYRVYLPQRTLSEAEQRAEQLRAQGLLDPVVYREGTFRFSIGLGSFRDRDSARKQVTQLERRGVRGVRVADNPSTERSTRVLIRGADAASVRQLEDVQKDFPQQKLQPCTPG